MFKIATFCYFLLLPFYSSNFEVYFQRLFGTFCSNITDANLFEFDFWLKALLSGYEKYYY